VRRALENITAADQPRFFRRLIASISLLFRRGQTAFVLVGVSIGTQ
jgi:hypothetical protein